MLNVIILIVKIIGIIIAAVLGFALFVMLLVLFVPIRYQGEAHKGEELQAEGKISWLFGLILFKVKYTGEKTKYALRICGYKLFSDEPKRKRKKVEKKRRPPVKKSEPELRRQKEDIPKRIPDQKSIVPKKDVVEPKTAAEQKSLPQQKSVSEQKETEKKQKISFWEKVKGFFLKLKGIKQKIRDMLSMIKRILGKIGLVKNFLFDYKNRPGFRVIFKEFKVLFKHLWPTKLKAYVHFGMEDPSQTGQILGAICAIYPQVLAKVALNPDFEQKVLEGDVEARGRIRIFTVLVIVLRVLMNKEFKVVWRNAKWLKEEL